MSLLCKLTVCFEDPFWIGLAEVESDDEYRVARHVFGPEPTEPEIEEFVRSGWKRLRFAQGEPPEVIEVRKINPKRMHRIVKKEMAACPTKGTKAQQALAEQREATKLERRGRSKEQRDAEKQRRFEMKSAKRKEKHRGH